MSLKNQFFASNMSVYLSNGNPVSYRKEYVNKRLQRQKIINNGLNRQSYNISKDKEQNTTIIDLKKQIEEYNQVMDIVKDEQEVGTSLSVHLAKQGIIPPLVKIWCQLIENLFVNHVKYYLHINDAPVPYHSEADQLTIFDQACYRRIPNVIGHKPDEQNKDGWTVAMILTYNEIEVPKCWYHDPELRNNYGDTVAIISAFRGNIPPKYWRHDPTISNCDQYTVALALAENGIIPPEEWYHDPTIQNNQFETVAISLALNDIMVGWPWLHDINMKNAKQQSIKSILYQKSAFYFNNFEVQNQKVAEYQVDVCQVCLQEGYQLFIQTTCGHKICYYCYKCIIDSFMEELYPSPCPVCRRQDWYYMKSDQYLDKFYKGK